MSEIRKMVVICIEGCHGSGKTELCTELERLQCNVLDEAFIGMPEFSLHPQSLIMETLWIANWFKRLLEKQKQCSLDPRNSTHTDVFFADRSPFSAIFYSQERGELLDPLVQEMLSTLRKSQIYVHTANLRVDKDILWNRIEQRLDKEPQRRKFNEHNREWMDKAVSFYDRRRWDIELENNRVDITNVANTLLRLVDSLCEQYMVS